jgi:hypothetical protein
MLAGQDLTLISDLAEEELNRVTAGKGGEKPVEYLKIKLTDVFVSGDQTGGGSQAKD